MLTLTELTARTAHPGTVTWLGLRPERRAAMVPVTSAVVDFAGLEGDHRARPGKRAVSLIQAEHLPVIAALSATPDVTFEMLRRNIAILGLNIQAMRHKVLRIGPCALRITGVCAPCSRMESALGPGGYTAVRGHGGMIAEVVTPGLIKIGDAVFADPPN
ncbi:MAG: MOSC domain-containing protein [Pseudomonadota bacterium]